jgi:hypothetical protein
MGIIIVQVTMLVIILTLLILVFFSFPIEKRFELVETEKKANGTYEQWADENKKALAVKKWSFVVLIIFAGCFVLSMIFDHTEHGFGIWTPIIFWLWMLFTSITLVLKIIFYKKAF